ncbi:hypothetical protein ACFFU1_14345 [Algibacter miyuki]|uniref:Uncharacterized protein n=1 Tax=Algibacter miyuki TaxID=1306933 RepID=A0ABV5H2V8_9FLAO|nr:hypothetical protein [Algibacter miyuki]MDN3664486.1 hypothetical protein [Algibacter miyuki]
MKNLNDVFIVFSFFNYDEFFYCKSKTKQSLIKSPMSKVAVSMRKGQFKMYKADVLVDNKVFFVKSSFYYTK